MKALSDMRDELEAVQASTVEGKDIIRPYSTRSWCELAGMSLTPPAIIWGGFALGTTGVIFGQGGLGKSRLAMNLVRNQVLGTPFAGLPTAPQPLKHLMMGSENSIHRLQKDVKRMMAGLTDIQIEMLDSHIRLATLEGPDDSFISLSSSANVERWRETLGAWPPDVLWVDPWGDVQIGEANSDDDTRITHSVLRRILSKVSPAAGLVILAHSRTGASNILQAIGYDAANFGKGSKALYSTARCVWNLAPGDESENPALVCVHAKNNDGQKERPFAIRLDPATMLYTRDDTFDLDAWQVEVSQRVNRKGIARRSTRLSDEMALNALGDNTATTTQVEQKLRDIGATRNEAQSIMRDLVIYGRWVTWRPKLKNAPTYMGTAAAMERRKKEVQGLLQGRLSI